MSTLRGGYTTGSCAAAAAKAAVMLLAEGRKIDSVEIPLPDGTRPSFPLVHVLRTADGAEAAVRKDAGDDPDTTNGALVKAQVAWVAGDGVEFAAGDGVGMVTKPGLATPPGRPAINPGPKRMITKAIREDTALGIRVTISIPGGAEIAKNTFNPRIGVEGGLSILGTTGIVRPFSCSALKETVRCALGVAAATGVRNPILVPGHIGERAVRAHFRATPEQVLEIGNEWGFTLEEITRHAFEALLITGHPGKLAKLTAGDWDTHSGRSGSAIPIVQALHERIFGLRPEAATVEGLFAALPAGKKKRLGDTLAADILKAVARKMEGKPPAAVVLIDLGGRILGEAGDMRPWQ